jgi:dihydroorotate dehydrogenase (NAD+) catalytic subunit
MSKIEFLLDKPLMNAAGTLGFSPDPKSPVDVAQFGAFVTNPVSWLPRTPVRGVRFIPYSGGFLLHTGHPNPGLRKVIQQHARRWARSPVPVIVHLLAQEDDSLRRMVARLEGVDGVMGVEIDLPPEINADQAYAMAVAAIGELSVTVKLPFEHCEELAWGLVNTSISAISLSAPRGALPAITTTPSPMMRGEHPVRELITGRIYGPTVFPQALAAVKTLTGLGIPVIGSGGVYVQSGVDAMLAAGAMAVQLDSVLWRGGIGDCPDNREQGESGL